MADRRSFQDIRRDGLAAYESFRAVVTDGKALAQWRAGVQPHQLEAIGEFTRIAATLPPPDGDLAFSSLASAAHHTGGTGVFGQYPALVAATGRAEANQLLAWYGSVQTELVQLVPEALSDELLWPEQRGSFTLEDLAARVQRYDRALGRTDAGLLALLLVLLRDWASDLHPLLSGLGYEVDAWIWDAAELARGEEASSDPGPAVEEVVGRLGLGETPQAV